ncbi:DUF2325 domain-containing protein [soil metagenome]
MCDHSKPGAQATEGEGLLKPAALTNPFATSSAGKFAAGVAGTFADALAGGSRRRRLWEIPRHCHCPVIGVCMPMGSLRKVLDKVLIGKTVASDYELHVGAVSECAVRNKISDALQRELERRCEAEIRRFSKAKTVDEVEALWREAVDAGDVSAALWAALTHPRCDGVLQETLCRDIHMIQHQAGACARADLKRVQSLIDENAVLARELGRVQTRSTQWQAERIAECERLSEELIKARGEAIGRDTLIAELRAENRQLRESTPDMQSRSDLTLRVAELKARARALEDELQDLRRANERDAERIAHLEQQRKQQRVDASAAAADEAADLAEASIPDTLPLGARSILCVGGRNSQVPIFRDLVERRGGRFAHHDGGIEDNPHRLDASLAAADLVICQTGCLSHNAYWLVKDHCKRTGKRCVYLESPSVAGFVRGLAQIPIKDAEAS